MAPAAAVGEVLDKLRSVEAAWFVEPSPELSKLTREASSAIYASLRPLCPPTAAALDNLLVDEVFDAEQIWEQIDVLVRPLLSSLRRGLKREERRLELLLETKRAEDSEGKGKRKLNDALMEDEVKEENDDGENEEEDEEEEEDVQDGEEEEEEPGNKGGGFEDKFLKVKDLEEYLEKGDAEYYNPASSKSNNRGKKKKGKMADDDEDEDAEGDDIDVGGGFEFGDDDDNDQADDFAENARYEDFFESKNKRRGKNIGCEKKEKIYLERSSLDGSEYLKMENKQDEDESNDTQGMEFLSTHEKEIRKMQSKIKQMEKENLEPKIWDMQGEVTAAKRPKNSALEVDLDFEHATRPPPVITEEYNASLEDMIKKRIIEGRFDNVQRAPSLVSKSPKEHKELDENKSQKGLAEIYEEEYARKTGLIAAPLSNSDERKREASILYKRLCFKLDALSHFQFAPKPVIEDMHIRSNVPALAMEEIAPLAVSDAAMLAPEEVFKGKGDTKEEVELTRTDRKRRRANKKRTFKAETARRAAQRARPKESSNGTEDHLY